MIALPLIVPRLSRAPLPLTVPVICPPGMLLEMLANPVPVTVMGTPIVGFVPDVKFSRVRLEPVADPLIVSVDPNRPRCCRHRP